MTEKQNIQQLFADCKLAEAVEKLNMLVEQESANAEWVFMRGKAYWRLGDRARAITDYEHAVQLDPNSPAVAALDMAREVMDFFNPDIFNP